MILLRLENSLTSKLRNRIEHSLLGFDKRQIKSEIVGLEAFGIGLRVSDVESCDRELMI